MKKENPLPKIVGGLFSYFHKIITYKSIKNKSEAAKKLSVNPFFLKKGESFRRKKTNPLFGERRTFQKGEPFTDTHTRRHIDRLIDTPTHGDTNTHRHKHRH